MNAERKVINMSLFATQVIYPDFWIRNTTAVSAFWIWLVFAVAIATSRTTTHFDVEIRGIHLPNTSFIYWSSADKCSMKLSKFIHRRCLLILLIKLLCSAASSALHNKRSMPNTLITALSMLYHACLNSDTGCIHDCSFTWESTIRTLIHDYYYLDPNHVSSSSGSFIMAHLPI